MRTKRFYILLAAIIVAVGVVTTAHTLRGRAKIYAIRLITEAVQAHIGPLYRFGIDGFAVHLRGGEVAVHGLTLTPDSTVVDSLAAAGHPVHTLCTASINDVRIWIRHPLRNLRHGRLDINRIEITFPRLKVVRDTVAGRVAAGPDTLFHSPFRRITIDRIDLYSGEVSYRRDSLRHRVRGLSIAVDRLRFDSLVDLRRLPLPGELRITAEESSHYPVGTASRLALGHIEADLRSRMIAVDTLSLTPEHGKADFARLTGKDWLELHSGRIALHGADISGGGLKADSLLLSGVSVGSYKNRQISQNETIKPLFNRLLQQSQTSITIDRIRVTDSRATYEELPVKGYAPGRITLTGIMAQVDSLTNVPGANTHYRMTARAHVMGGVLSARFTYPVSQSDESFLITGTFKGADVADFTPMTKPLGNIEGVSGHINRLDFNIYGDDRSGKVTMRMAYDSLEVAVLGKLGLRSWIGTAVVNNFILLPSNPIPGEELREVRASAIRDPHRSHFNYIWRISFAGIKESVGLTEKRQEKITSLQKQFTRKKGQK